MKEYPLSKGYKVTGIVFGAALFLGGFWMVWYVLGGDYPYRNLRPLGCFLGLIPMALGFWVYRQAVRIYVTVDSRRLTVRQAFRTRSIALVDIAGYRVGMRDILILVPKDGKRTLHIPEGLQNRHELRDWIYRKYPDADEKEKAAETEELLKDDRFGTSRSDRGASLEKAGKLGQALHTIGTILCVWAVFYPRPFGTMMAVLFIAPLIGAFITWYYKGLMRLDVRKNSPYPSAILLMILPLCGALVAILQTYELYNFPFSAWMFMIGLAIVLTLAALASFRPALAAVKKKIVAVCTIALVALLYSWDVLVFSNCRYDRSDAQAFSAHVLDKRSSSGTASTSYFLELSHWGKYPDGEEVEVSKSLYDAVDVQNTVCVLLFQGKWGIPWYTVIRCE